MATSLNKMYWKQLTKIEKHNQERSELECRFEIFSRRVVVETESDWVHQEVNIKCEMQRPRAALHANPWKRLYLKRMVSEVGEKQCYESQRRKNVKEVDLINGDRCNRMVKKRRKNFVIVIGDGQRVFLFLVVEVILCSRWKRNWWKENGRKTWSQVFSSSVMIGRKEIGE